MFQLTKVCFNVRINPMLARDDLGQIQKMITTSLGDFFEKVLAPYLQGEFDKIDNQFKENGEDHDDIFRKLDQNQKEHDEMFVRLDRIENKVDGHERRIKKLEKTLQTS